MAITPEEHINLMASVGRALAAWTRVETALSLLFCTASRMPRDKANAVYDAIVAFEARLAVCDRVMAHEKMEQLEHAIWGALYSRLRKQYRKRHEVAHFSMTLDKQGQMIPYISPFFTWGKFNQDRVTKLDAAQIGERTARFDDLERRAFNLTRIRPF